MYMPTVQREVESAGFTETASFKIEANAKAFRILIDKLYSDIHVAIVRELLANAWDAHVLAETSATPPRLHVPSVYEPYFSIRDFGCSMTHQQVMTLYSTIFRSTKDQRNDQVGAFGMGSKTPFGYTDTFGVQCWLDGVLRIYSVFIDNQGVPKIALAHTDTTSEPNGVEVQFPVNGKDIDAFKTAIDSVMIGHDVLPEFTGGTVELTEKKVSLTGPGWTIYVYDEPVRNAHARQGCVLYPLSYSSLSSFVKNGKDVSGAAYPEYVKQLFTASSGVYDLPIVVDFDIGSIEVTANREELSYSPETCQRIIERFTTMFDEIVFELKDAVDKSPSLLEASKHALDFVKHAARSDAVRRYLTQRVSVLRYRGFKLRELFRVSRTLKKVETPDPATGKVETSYVKTKFAHVDFSFTHSSELFKKNRRSVKFHSLNDLSLSWENYYIIYVEIINERGKGQPGIGARAWNDAAHQTTGRTPGVLWVKTPSVDHLEFLRLMAYLGRPQWKLAADLPMPERDTERSYGITEVKRLDGYRFVNFDAFDIERDAGYFVPLRRGEIDYPEFSSIEPSKLGNMVMALIEVGALPKDMQIIGVPASRMSLLKQSDDWIEALPEIVAAYNSALDLNKVVAAFYIDKMLSKRTNAAYEMLEELVQDDYVKAIAKMIPGSPFLEALEAIRCIADEQRATKAQTDLYAARSLLPSPTRHGLEQIYNVASTKAAKADDLVDMAFEIIEESVKPYRLLSAIAAEINNRSPRVYDLELLCEYIALVDKNLTGCGKCGNVTSNEKVLV